MLWPLAAGYLGAVLGLGRAGDNDSRHVWPLKPCPSLILTSGNTHTDYTISLMLALFHHGREASFPRLLLVLTGDHLTDEMELLGWSRYSIVVLFSPSLTFSLSVLQTAALRRHGLLLMDGPCLCLYSSLALLSVYDPLSVIQNKMKSMNATSPSSPLCFAQLIGFLCISNIL